MRQYVVGGETTGAEIREARRRFGMTQKEFAAFLECSKRAVESWEAKTGPVTGPVVALLDLLWRHPYLLPRLEGPEKKLKMRLWYMYRDKVCTLIDVDDLQRVVEIKNYTDDLLYCAFGVKQHPEYADYLAFLESRCFPASRDKLKLELKERGIPFYDPMLIIEKTEGRMAEDDFWLKIER